VAGALPAPLTGAGGNDPVGLFSSCLPGWDAAHVIEIARSLEFAVIEWGAGPREAVELGQDGASLRERCAAAGVGISGLSVQDEDVTVTAPRRALPYLRLAGALGAQFIRLFAPPYTGGPIAGEQRRARDGLDAIVEHAAEEGVAVLIETSPATLAPTPGLAAALVDHQAPERAGVLFDPGNTVIEGYVRPALAVARMGPHLHHLHVKNIAWRKVSGGWAWRHASLMGGFLSWPDILAVLAAAGYRGGYSIDHLSGKPTRGRLQSETEALRALLGDASVDGGGATNDSTEKGATPSPASA
jgi:sugar phosphate isomerase/epimerase